LVGTARGSDAVSVPLRICLIGFSGYPDQGMTFFYEMARSLARLGHDVHAFAVGRDGEPSVTSQDDVSVHRVPMPLTVNWSSPARWGRKAAFLAAASNFLRRERFDIAHVYCTIGSIVLPLLGGARAWVLEHQTGAVSQRSEHVRRLENRLRAWQGTTYDINFTVTDVLGERLFGSKRRFEVVPAGVNLGAFGAPRSSGLRQELGIADDEIVFVHAGVLEALRATDVPVRAFAQARAHYPRMRLLMPGKGSQLEELRALAVELGVGAHVWLPGYVPYGEIPGVFAAADAGLSYLPPVAYYEGQPPMKVMEYLGAGLPVIASDVSSHRRLLQDGHNGLLAAPGPEGYAAAMVRFASDISLRRRLASAAAPSVAHMTWDTIARDRVVPAYERLLQRAR
jgi:glycosyltransferase involved in cell wall biosynthesis